MRPKKNITIPETTLERLPLYYRTIKQLEERKLENISSADLAGFLNVKPEQIRKDLAACGNFGIRSVGYYVADLRRNLGKVLGYQNKRNIGIIGAGFLGSTLALDKNISDLGFKVVAVFDNDESIIGSEIGDVKIYDFSKFGSVAKRKLIDIGVITVEKEFAQKTADILVAAGIKGIWNFSPIKIFAPEEIPVVETDLTFSLSVLNYLISHADSD